MVSIKRADVLSSCGIISCSWLRYDTVLAITERNGSITFYDSFSIAVIDETQNSLSLRSFAEVGLVFPSHKNGMVLKAQLQKFQGLIRLKFVKLQYLRMQP